MNPEAFCKKNRLNGAQFGRRVGISRSLACRLIQGTRKVSPDLAKQIERRTGRAVTRYDLRPDIFGKKPSKKPRASIAAPVASLATPSQPHPPQEPANATP